MILMPVVNPVSQPVPSRNVGVSNPTGVSSPPNMINNDLTSLEQKALSSTGAGGKRSLKKAIVFFVVFVVVAVFAYFYFFMSGSQAGEYWKQVNGDFEKVTGDMKALNFKNAVLAKNASLLQISKNVYYDLSQSVIFDEASADAKADLDQIKTVQAQIAQAQENRKKFRVGGDVRSLNKYWSEYLDTQQEGMDSLGKYADDRVVILNAVGDEYYRELTRLLSVYSKSTSSEDRLEYFDNLALLAAESVVRLKAIEGIGDDGRLFYDFTLETQEDIAQTMKAVAGGLRSQDAENNSSFDDNKLKDLGERQIARNDKFGGQLKVMVGESKISKLFNETVQLEEKTREELDKLKEKYGAGDSSGQ